jgi:hypothetical protein
MWTLLKTLKQTSTFHAHEGGKKEEKKREKRNNGVIYKIFKSPFFLSLWLKS